MTIGPVRCLIGIWGTWIVVSTGLFSCGPVCPTHEFCTEPDASMKDAGPMVDAVLRPDASLEMPLEPCPLADASPCDGYLEWPPFDTWAVSVQDPFIAQAQGEILLAEHSHWGSPEPSLLLRDGNPWQWQTAEPDYSARGFTPRSLAADERLYLDQGHITCSAGAAWCILVLGCDSAGCLLLGVPRGEPLESAIQRVPASEVPAALVPRGLSELLPVGSPIGSVCAYGDGVACFDGAQWNELLPPGSGPPLTGLVVLATSDATPDLVAAGEEGRLLLYAEGVWTELTSGSSETLLALAAKDGVYTAAGEGGILIRGTRDQLVVDRVATQALVGVTSPQYLWYLEHTILWALTSGGCLMRISLTGDGLSSILSTCILSQRLVGFPLSIDPDAWWGFCGGNALLSDGYLAYLTVDCTE